MLNFRTDMADERVSEYKKQNNLSNIDGVNLKKSKGKYFEITHVEVLDKKGEEALSKKIGKYISMEIEDVTLLEDETLEKITNEFSKIIKEVILPYNHSKVLVVGLGNKSVTPDSLGPKVIDKIDVTRHLFNFAKEFVKDTDICVSAISPGVLGTTGIETSEIINAIVKKIKPDLVIAIDSLASLSYSRVGKSIQITDTGISPGSGVKNKRKELSYNTLNVPVVAIGIPLVVDMAMITYETIQKIFNHFEITEDKLTYSFIADILKTENYMVTPKEIDVIVENLSIILAKSINKVLK